MEEVVSGEYAREQGESVALEGSFVKEFDIVGAKVRSDGDGAALSSDPLGLFAVDTVIEAFVMEEILGRGGCSVFLEISGAGDDVLLYVEDFFGDEGRVFEISGADGDIETFFDHVDIAGGGKDFESHVRVSAKELEQHLGEGGALFGGGHGDTQGATWRFVHLTDGFFGFFDGGDDLSAAAVVGLSEFGQVDRSGGSGDELCAEAFFETRYPPTEGGFGDLEMLCGGSKTSEFNDFDEGGHLILAAHTHELQGIRGWKGRRDREKGQGQRQRSLRGRR